MMNSIDDALSAIDARGFPRPYLSSSYAVTARQVTEAEANFGQSFPPSYREFLLKVGSGDFRGLEFCGLVPAENAVEEPANTLWLTKSMQSDGLPPELLVVEELGDGVLACLDFTRLDGVENPVVLWDPSESSDRSRKILAKSFGDYFMNRILTVLS